MAWNRREPKWPWRAYLTLEESAVLAQADAAKREWQRLNQARATITNRAIQRAKYAAASCPTPIAGEPVPNPKAGS